MLLRLSALLVPVLLSFPTDSPIRRPAPAEGTPGAAEVARLAAMQGAVGDPAIIAMTQGRLDVFIRGQDDALWQKTWANGAWTDWTSRGGRLTSSPAASSWGNGRIDIFAKGVANELIHTYYNNAWSGIWEPLGGVLTSDPAAVSWGANRIDVFARGTDNALYHLWFGGSWSAWERLGGNMASGPAVSTWGANRLDVFARGADNRIDHIWFDGRWNNWEKVTTATTESDPAAASYAPNRIDVFIREIHGILQQITWANGWSLATVTGTIGTTNSTAMLGGPDVATTGWNQLDLVVRGADQTVYNRRLTNSAWSAWIPLGLPGMATVEPAPVATVSAVPYDGSASASGLNLSMTFTDVELDKGNTAGAVAMRGPNTQATQGSQMRANSFGLPAGDYRFQVDFVKVSAAATVMLTSGSTSSRCSLAAMDAVQTCKHTVKFTGGGSVLDFTAFVQSGARMIPVKLYLHKLQ